LSKREIICRTGKKILVSGFDIVQKFLHVNKLLMFGTMKWGGVGGDGMTLVSL
jgi:hypothetical protein